MPACAVLVVSPPALSFSEPQDIVCFGINLEAMVFRFVKFGNWAVVIRPTIVGFAVEFTAEELWIKFFTYLWVDSMEELPDVGYCFLSFRKWVEQLGGKTFDEPLYTPASLYLGYCSL